MPPWTLEAHSEHEICFATYYDITRPGAGGVPGSDGTMFRFTGQELRQDPQSHHLILNPLLRAAPTCTIRRSARGPATAASAPGRRASRRISPRVRQRLLPQRDPAVVRLHRLRTERRRRARSAIGGAQKAQASIDYVDGVFAQIPMKGILYWNSHAFNLTDDDTTMHARLNYYFATEPAVPAAADLRHSRDLLAERGAVHDADGVQRSRPAAGRAPLRAVVAHAQARQALHRRRRRTARCSTRASSTTTPSAGSSIRRSPSTRPIRRERTLRYCSLYNNGVAADGSPDPDDRDARLARAGAPQRLPAAQPIACVAGKVGAPCAGVDDDARCDSSPGAGDGACDACPITGGESTENEMFILQGGYYVAPGAGG